MIFCRNSSIQITAIKWTGFNPIDVMKFIGYQSEFELGGDFIINKKYVAKIGDYLIRDTQLLSFNGDYVIYPCDSNLFKMLFPVFEESIS